MEPLDLDTVADFGEDYEAWTLQDSASGRYVTVPDPRYPGRRPIRFFMKEADAQSLLGRLREVNPAIRAASVRPVKVPLLRALRGVAADRTPGNADSFVMHSPNEVYDWLKD